MGSLQSFRMAYEVGYKLLGLPIKSVTSLRSLGQILIGLLHAFRIDLYGLVPRNGPIRCDNKKNVTL